MTPEEYLDALAERYAAPMDHPEVARFDFKAGAMAMREVNFLQGKIELSTQVGWDLNARMFADRLAKILEGK